MLKWTTIGLGVVTAIVMAVPSLVVLGFFLLFIPGLILACIPTLFVYSLATLLIRNVLLRKKTVPATLVSFGITLVVSALVMLPWRISENTEFEAVASPQVEPAPKLSLNGDILLDVGEERLTNGADIPCDWLCVALLDTPGVTSVTRRSSVGIATFRKGANWKGPLASLVEPQTILKKLAELNEERQHLHIDERRRRQRDYLAMWALRIANGEEIHQVKPLDPEAMEWTIRVERSSSEGEPKVERVEVADAEGTVRARRSLVKHFVPAPLFYFGFDGGSAAGGFTGAGFETGGSVRSNQDRYFDFDFGVELLRVVDVTVPEVKERSADILEKRLESTLDNPAASEAELSLAHLWLTQWQYDAGPKQMPLIARILGDERIDDPAVVLQTALNSKADLTPLRHGLANRYLSASDTKSKTWYVKTLVGLPAGTFAEPTDEELAIWTEAIDSPEAAPFVERVADMGPETVPQLMTLIDRVKEKKWHARWRVLRGVRNAFKRLGPDGAAAIPKIQSLISDSPQVLLNSSKDRREWLVALNLMGVPAEKLPFAKTNLTPDELASEVRNIKRYVEFYRSEQQ